MSDPNNLHRYNMWQSFQRQIDQTSGNKQGRSCTTNLLLLLNNTGKRRLDYCALLNLKKAFDKLSHRKLLRKPETIGGIHGKLLYWMKDFYTQESETRVLLEKKNVIRGVPQGSVLCRIHSSRACGAKRVICNRHADWLNTLSHKKSTINARATLVGQHAPRPGCSAISGNFRRTPQPYQARKELTHFWHYLLFIDRS